MINAYGNIAEDKTVSRRPVVVQRDCDDQFFGVGHAGGYIPSERPGHDP